VVDDNDEIRGKVKKKTINLMVSFIPFSPSSISMCRG